MVKDLRTKFAKDAHKELVAARKRSEVSTYSQKEIAYRLGVDTATYQRIERFEEDPGDFVGRAILKKLGVSESRYSYFLEAWQKAGPVRSKEEICQIQGAIEALGTVCGSVEEGALRRALKDLGIGKDELRNYGGGSVAARILKKYVE